MKKCILISGAVLTDTNFLRNNIASDDFIICADAGYITALRCGCTPSLIVGDFDSACRPDFENVEILDLPCEKDDSDTLAAVKAALDRGYREFDIYGAMGNRIDHSYANILTLDYIYRHGGSARILTPYCEISLLKSGVNTICQNEYRYFSLFSFLEKTEHLSIIGAKYPLEDVSLEPFSQIGISNEIAGSRCDIVFKTGKLLLIRSND